MRASAFRGAAPSTSHFLSMHLSKITLLSILALTSRTFACDLCGCYTPRLEVVHEKPFNFFAGIAEQFTHFGTDRCNGDKVDNPTDQHLDSSITQAIAGVKFWQNRLGVQANVPFIYRSYRRPEGFEIEHGDESGLGDVSLLANFVVFKTDTGHRTESGGFSKDGKRPALAARGEPDFSASFNLIAGIKFPTGDTDRLLEESEEGHHAAGGGAPAGEEHGQMGEGHGHEHVKAPANGIHGHDLALGTGSYDGVFGAQTFVRYQRVFFQADVQYTVRGEGDHSYNFADDLQWRGGPGAYVLRRGGDSLSVQCVLSGETKGYDTFEGERAVDSGITSLYIGPRVNASFGRFSGEVEVDLPVIMNTTDFQTTADYRIRAGISIAF